MMHSGKSQSATPLPLSSPRPLSYWVSTTDFELASAVLILLTLAAQANADPANDNEAVGVATKRLSEAEFLAKWGHIVTRVDAGAPASAAMMPVGRRSLQGGNPFALLLQAIQQITGAWQSIVNAFKSQYSEQIADKEFANGWSKFKQSTKVFKGAPTQP